ncbi:glycosyltransferase family 2 protein [Sphingobacterium hotanense]|uniref:glycosyltransferase family 2 protein n=1 Tax=Sphingobacterium hotanense TaxID=649196 RepID=UPI0011F12C6D|nr:glycosyltransferase family 2 protein [Sphingobacterium hotanense]
MLTKQYKVSVTIPVYNVEDYLEQSVNSLMSQTLKGIELIFIDDCSTDNSLEKLNGILGAIQIPDTIEVKILQNNENKGVAYTRNVGLLASSGKYIASIDPDDFIECDMLKIMFEKAELERAEIVWCDYVNVFKDERSIVRQDLIEKPRNCIEGLLRGELFGGMCNKLILRSLFTANNVQFPAGQNMSEDLRVCVQLFFYAKTVRYVDRALYFYVQYRENSISLTNTNVLKINYEWFENIKAVELFLHEKELNELVELVMILKLVSKKNLLVKGKSIEDFKQWRDIFPESNQYINQTDLPLHYKFIANKINKEAWFFPKFWILIKKILRK